jgi:nitrogen fixation/metabolism regulation signal transduction histidine kinase
VISFLFTLTIDEPVFSASLTRRAVASAVIISVGTLGGVLSGQIYQITQKPRYFIGNTIAFSFIVLQTILIVILRLVFAFINRQRSRMNNEQMNEQIEHYGGKELAGDRHPEYRYT